MVIRFIKSSTNSQRWLSRSIGEIHIRTYCNIQICPFEIHSANDSPYIIQCRWLFIQYFARNWPWYSLRGLHIRITWFSLYGIRIPLFSLYGIHMPLLPYMVIQPIVLDMALLWVAMDSSLSQGPVLWRHNDVTVIVSRNTRGRERDTQQRLDNANARRLQTVNR